MALWESHDLVGLLSRIEVQTAGATRDIAEQSAGDKQLAAATRAKRLAREGARSKAVNGLKGGIRKLESEDQKRWAAKLLPRSTLGEGAFARQASQLLPGTTEGDQVRGQTNSEGPPPDPLKGIRYPPMSGPGPSGCRPEHVVEMLTAKKRCVANRLRRAIAQVIERGKLGTLPQAMRWILGSGVTFLDKNGRETPRPIRSGEWFRKTVAKSLLREHRAKINALMTSFGQYGTLPGGAEALFHARSTIEEVASAGCLGLFAIVDIDLVNCFGSFEWPSVREAYNALLPELLPWEKWCTSEPSEARLPCGEAAVVDRGAGQGEPDGPIKAATTIGHRTRLAKSDLTAAGIGSWVDGWFLDDGQIYCRPAQIEPILRALDQRLSEAGATRGRRSTGDDIKSTVKIFGPPEQTQQAYENLGEYVLDTCKVVSNSESCTVLGGQLGTAEQQALAFNALGKKVAKLHELIDSVGDPATEFVLKSTCADVCKATYMLRLNGDQIPEQTLQGYATILRDSLGVTLGGELGDEAWSQSTCAFSEGGLGFRTPEEVSLPAFVASRTTAKPGANALFARLVSAGLAPPGVLDAVYNARTNLAFDRLLARCEDDTALCDQLRATVESSAVSATLVWEATVAGTETIATGNGGAMSSANEWDMHTEQDVTTSGSPRARPLQRELCRALDKRKTDHLTSEWLAHGRYDDLRRLADLRDPHQDHSWICALNPAVEATMPPREWTTAMRLRLGCNFTAMEMICGACGQHVVDKQGYHALCCAKGDSARGHYRVGDALLGAFASADTTAACEVPGLVPSQPGLRPADILTLAAHPRLAMAVDVMVKSPNATGAGHDCTEAGKREKLDHYRNILPELEAQGIWYAPAVFSAFGRRHPDVTRMLNEAARRVARHRGCTDKKELVRGWKKDLAVAVWKRAAAMVHRCFRHAADDSAAAAAHDEDDDSDTEEYAPPTVAAAAATLTPP